MGCNRWTWVKIEFKKNSKKKAAQPMENPSLKLSHKLHMKDCKRLHKISCVQFFPQKMHCKKTGNMKCGNPKVRKLKGEKNVNYPRHMLYPSLPPVPSSTDEILAHSLPVRQPIHMSRLALKNP